MIRRFCPMFATTVVVSVWLSTPAVSGVIRHDVDPQAYLDLAQDSRYQGVGQITLQASDGNHYAGSGSLISSNWVLTAAHVVDDALSLNFHLGGQTYTAKQWIAHPKYSSDFSYDIGLVELELAPPVAPAARYTGSNELGKVGTFVGYGLTGNGLTGTDFTSSLQKRAGQNMIDVAFVDTGGRRNWRVFGVDFDSPDSNTSRWGSSSPLDLEYLVSFGDSGGGVFIEESGQTYLAGIHSFIVDANNNGLWGDYGDYTGHVRVSVFNSWIDSIIGASDGGGGGGGGNGPGGRGKGKPTSDFIASTNAVPEPGTATLMCLGALWISFRRRRTSS